MQQEQQKRDAEAEKSANMSTNSGLKVLIYYNYFLWNQKLTTSINTVILDTKFNEKMKIIYLLS